MNLGPADYERALALAGVSEMAVIHSQSTGSTNDDARGIAASPRRCGPGGIAIVIAETQTEGRGRGSNSWFSPEGSIAFTITVPEVEVGRLGVLPLGVGASVTHALRQLGVSALVKWPNDVLIDGLKVCGILCESSLLFGTARVYVGIGINVGPLSAAAGTLPLATTLSAHGLKVDRPALVADITARVLGMIRGGATAQTIVNDWKAVSVPWWGKTASVVEGEVKKRVTLLDVSPGGQLVVRDEAGVVRSFVSGDVRQIREDRA